MTVNFDGPRLKVARARELISDLDGRGRELLKKNSYQFVPSELNADGKLVLRIREGRDNQHVPAEWSVLIGEVAHDLRSALDQVICALAADSQPDDPNICSSTSFPIFLLGPEADAQPSSKFSLDRRAIQPLTDAQRKAVQDFQPFSPGRNDVKDPLWLLHELNNADKHRLIQTVVVKAGGAGYAILDFDKSFEPAHLDLGAAIEEGAVVGWADPRVFRRGELNRFGPMYAIAFGPGCEVVRGRAVAATLRAMADGVSEVIDAFAKGLGAAVTVD